MKSHPLSQFTDWRVRGQMMWLALVLVTVLGFLFHSSFRTGQALFANDGPLGVLNSRSLFLPAAFTGIWTDLYWVGANGGSASAGFTYALLWLLGPILFNKFYVPAALLILGMSAGYFFKRLGFNIFVSVLGGMAVALNGNYFSNACWGLATRALCLASVFLALAALQTGAHSRSWFRAILLTVLAGLGVGMAISEGADNGAIFSLFVAAFAFFQNLIRTEESPVRRIIKGVARVVVMAVFAALLAAQTLNIFVTTSVKGIVGVRQDAMTKEQKWDWATQWSLPKIETLRVIIPGLFGYRLDTGNGGNYWGRVGQQPGWEVHRQGFVRHSGAGEYAGVLVMLVAVWAFAQATRKSTHAFTVTERRMVWFWGVAAVLALLLAWGRFAPFYRLLYLLPYFSTIRNPMKFMHPFHLCLMVLFAYGLHGLTRLYLDKIVPSRSLVDQWKAWWAKAELFEKRWTYGVLGALALSVLAFLIYANSQQALIKHLVDVRCGMHIAMDDTTAAPMIARFSVRELGLFVVFLAASATVVLLIQSSAFAGKRAKWAAVLLGIVLVVDLGRASAPWIVYYNWRDKYASNPILDVLRTRPHEHRVSIPPFQISDRSFQLLQQIYQVEWTQHQFPFYNIQSLDIPQEPRMPADKAAYRLAVLSGQLFAAEDFTNVIAFAGLLRDKTTPLSGYLLEKLSANTRQLLQTAAASPSTNALAEALAGDLNALIRTESVYSPERFANIVLPPGISNLVQKAMFTPEELVGMNRALLDAAFPNYLARNVSGGIVRLWELTNTRYLLGVVGLSDLMNAQIDSGRNRFRSVMAFEFYQAGDNIIGARTNAAGRNTLIEFTGALPRVKLYSQWQVITNDDIVLGKLPRASFDLQRTVLVSQPIATPAGTAPGDAALKAEITSYAPKKVTLRTSASETPTVLLINSKWDEGWKVTVDGKPAPLLRCNYLMQGVALPAGEHTVQMSFEPKSTIFFVSLAAVMLGLVLCGLLFVVREPREPAPAARTAAAR